MTQEQFDQLPMLLRRKVAMQALGVDRRTLDKIQDSDPELTIAVPGLKDRRVRKERLARLLNLGV